MKIIIALFIAAVAITAIIQGPAYVYAQDTSPVETPVVEPQPPAPPDDPVPIPDTLLQLVLEVIKELGGWVTGIVILGIGTGEKWLVGLIRRFFPNEDKTGTALKGGLAQITAGLTAVVVALITFGVAWLSNYVSGIDLGSILVVALGLLGGGELMHKTGKLSNVAKVFNLLTEMSK